jgi:hypothetical protein
MKVRVLTKFFVSSLVVLSLMILTGCEGDPGPQGPEGQTGTNLINVLGYIYGPTLTDSTPDASISVFNSPSVPSASINNIDLEHRPAPWPGHEGFEFWDDLSISNGESASLLVTYTKLDGNPGTAQASGALPGSFEITSHDTGSVNPISLQSDLTITWSASSGMDAYLVHFSSHYHYTDYLGNQHYGSTYYDSLLITTTITYTPTQIVPNPSEIDTLDYINGGFYIYAVDGPIFQGDIGNVTGEGYGFFLCSTYGGALDFSSDSTSNQAREGKDDEEHIRDFIMERATQILNLSNQFR